MNRLWIWFHQLGSPPYFFRLSSALIPWLYGAFVLSATIGVVWGLRYAPTDYLQGESYRIIYIHVPSAWMSLMVFVLMAIQGALALIWRIKLCELLMIAMAPVGATFTAVTLLTGMLWGKPTWGTYWVWDARLTSQLVLLFLYLGVIGLYSAYGDRRAGARAAAILALVGVVNIPIIKYSVEWWNTLHQGETINVVGRSSIDPSMLWPLLVMALATKFYFAGVVLLRTRNLVLEQERGKAWVVEALGVGTGRR